jgi:uncharacterized protein (DUF302 family)
MRIRLSGVPDNYISMPGCCPADHTGAFPLSIGEWLFAILLPAVASLYLNAGMRSSILPLGSVLECAMDRRRFLLGSAVGASLLTGWTQADRARAQPAAEKKNTDNEMTDDGTAGRIGEEAPSIPEKAGLVTTESADSFAATVARITSTIESNPNLTLITTVDHAANAESVGKELPPTTLVIFGNPALGTPLMQRERTIGIDLPQKMLIWQEDQTVNVTYNDPFYLADRHGITDAEKILTKIATALQKIATEGGLDEDDDADDQYQGPGDDDDGDNRDADGDSAIDEDDEDMDDDDDSDGNNRDDDGDGAIDEDDDLN